MNVNEEEHVMLSYSWKSQKIVKQIYNLLRKENIPVWFDIQGGMKVDIYKSMAKGVENAFVVYCFMSPEYQESDNCKLELKYAQTRRKRIIPCIVTDTQGWKPSDWLGLITAGLLYVNFKDYSEKQIELKTKELIGHIQENSFSKESFCEPTYLIELIKYKYTQRENTHVQSIFDGNRFYPIKVNSFHFKNHQIEDLEGKHRILITGPNGIGKTSLCQYLAYQWSINSFACQYKHLIFIRLRHLTMYQYPPNETYSIFNLINKEIFGNNLSQDDEKLFESSFDIRQTLWILDGYDEILLNIPPHLGSLLKQLMNMLFQIVTSQSMTKIFSNHFQMEIIGFNQQNIEEYCEEKVLFEFVKKNQRIWGFAHVPMHMEMIWNLSLRENLQDLTITKLYSKIIELLCEKNEKVEEFFATLAFNAMKNNTIILRSSLIKPILAEMRLSQEEYFSIKNLRIWKKSANDQQIDGDYYFISTAFQEYFTAKYLIKENQLWKIILEKPLDLVGITHIQLIIFCLEQSNLLERVELFHPIIKWIEFILSPRYFHIYKHFLDSLQFNHSLSHLNSLNDLFIKLLRSRDSNEKLNVCYLISKLSFETPSQLLIQMLIKTFDDKDSDVRESACKAMVSMAEKSSNDNIMKNLVIALSNGSNYIRQYACRTIENICEENVITDEVGRKLVDLLRDEDEFVRKNACQALGKLREKNEVVDYLISALRDEDENVCTNVCKILQQIGETNVSNELINKLLGSLKHKIASIRQYSCVILGDLGEKVMKREVITELLSATNDESYFVRGAACQALGKIGSQVLLDEIFSKLLFSLEDNKDYVRMHACEALGSLGAKITTNEVIGRLIFSFNDQNETVRDHACLAMANIGRYFEINQITRKLLNAIHHENPYVRQYACLTLGKMSEYSARGEIIEKLISALSDTDEYVRMSICQSLGQIGKDFRTNEITEKLIATLQDESENVQRYACISLRKLGETIETNRIIRDLIMKTKNEDESIRMKAYISLDEISKREISNEFWDKLVNTLEHENEYIYQYVCLARGKTENNQVISRLRDAMAERNENIQRYACKALAKLGESAANEEIIGQLRVLLNDSNEFIRGNACETLRSFREKAIQTEVIGELMKRLIDDDEHVRFSAFQIIECFTQIEETNLVIKYLISGIEHEDEFIRLYSCLLLRNMKEKQVTHEIIDKIGKLLEDHEVNIQISACETLGIIGKLVETERICQKLVHFIENNRNSRLRASLCQTIGNLGEKLRTNPVFTEFLRVALTDNNDSVRLNAYQALASLSAITDEILLIALEDESKAIRKYACEYLSQSRAKNFVIKRLFQCLKDEDQFDLVTIRSLIEKFSSETSQFDTELVEYLYQYVDRFGFCDLNIVELFEKFVSTNEYAWLSVAVLATIFKGYAVCLEEHQLIMYDEKELVKVDCFNEDFSRKIIETFRRERERLEFPSIEIPTHFLQAEHQKILSTEQINQEGCSVLCNLL
ncbi:unnamed protein product [Adineta ricciae]|uniref:NACHT domain-containing protein n=1 Tax=Adineta ricciae TaxID=249248 RepID=A0A815IAW8_ADIRI|nr:unnamed protein product [Adineta ricciae]CAF1365917.1 unnamed protein product [Adineta ricciae]